MGQLYLVELVLRSQNDFFFNDGLTLVADPTNLFFLGFACGVECNG